MIGICAAVEQARFGPWDQRVTLLPESYARAVQAAGGLALIVPPDELAAGSPDELLDRLDALVLAGGTDVDPGSHGAERAHPEVGTTNPERDRFELALARRALERDLPLLGICRGMQVLNVAAGGTLDQHLPDALGHEDHRPTPGVFAEHRVRLDPASLASRAAGAEELAVKSHHHQGLAEVGDGLEPTAWSVPDEVVEAIERPGSRFALGVLWHPEESPEDRVIPAFVAAAGR
jgi:putative glutamine amidotransferase